MGIEEHRHNTGGVLADLAGKEAADHLLKQFQSLTDLSRASFDDLTQITGIGPSKAKAIRSAFLLAQELAKEKRKDYPILDNPGTRGRALPGGIPELQHRTLQGGVPQHPTTYHQRSRGSRGNSRYGLSPPSRGFSASDHFELRRHFGPAQSSDSI